MALIRQASATIAARDAIVLDLGDIMRQGDLVKARAREAADRIIAEAHREREQLINGAAEQGHREGLERGTAEGKRAGEELGKLAALAEYKDRLTVLDSKWTGALAQFEQDRDGILLEARQDVLRLAVQMGELITRRAIEVRPDAVVDQLAAVLSQVCRPTRLAIRVNPADRSLIEAALPGMGRAVSNATHLELTDDPALERGSVIARSANGSEVDASIPTQLARIAATLIPSSGPATEAEHRP